VRRKKSSLCAFCYTLCEVVGIKVDDARKLEEQKLGKKLTLKMGATKVEVKAPSMVVVIRNANRVLG